MFLYCLRLFYKLVRCHLLTFNISVLLDCVSPQMIAIMKSLISLCFFAIVFTLAAFIMDLLGPTHRMLKVIRRNGICNILTGKPFAGNGIGNTYHDAGHLLEWSLHYIDRLSRSLE